MSQLNQPSSFDYEALLAAGRGELFGPQNAKLPAPPMLMFDRIVTINADGGAHGKGYIEAELDIHPDLWFFQCHFIGDPVMPGCLGLDGMWQLTGFYLGWLGEPGRGLVARSVVHHHHLELDPLLAEGARERDREERPAAPRRDHHGHLRRRGHAGGAGR